MFLFDDIDNVFAAKQEGVRKAVERVFGVLIKRFQIFYRPCRLYKVEDMENFVEACIILHIMACDEKRSTYTGSRSCRLRIESEDLETHRWHLSSF